MFYQNDIVRVWLPNTPGDGYDYRLSSNANIGCFVRATLQNRPIFGVIVGEGNSALPPEKIKPCNPTTFSVPETTIAWLKKMSDWTMMSPGAVLRLLMNVPDAFEPPKTEPLYIYNAAIPTRMTTSRQAVADAFASNDNIPMTILDIRNIAHVSAAVIKAMIQNETLTLAAENIVGKLPIANYYDTGNVVLNDEQKSAADKISSQTGFNVSLLDGITGSGKTQVYFDSVMAAYKRGKSVLLMMPEIALTAQFMHRFADRFGAPPVVWHSNLTAARRRDIWRGVANGEIRIVVGTRSALFLPWQNMGLIVVDEEHDSSYKQEDMGNYHARDMAILRAHIENFPVVLASATPSAETVQKVIDGKYNHLQLVNRFGGATMPKIEIIDMRGQPSDGILSDTMRDAIADTLNANQQVMLFINRRGHSPIVGCKKCGWTATCPDCSAGMTFHKRTGKLLCHICGRTAPFPDKCPDCGEPVFLRGTGIEKVADEVSKTFPSANIALVSSDTIGSRQALERLVMDMESGKTNIVIGTQILAKGHHFPNLTLVGVVDADAGLFSPDFRSSEHTFHQLFQVAGRAGRGAIPGTVLLQSYQPAHPVLNAIVNGNRDEFMAQDMQSRQAAQMPPFGQLVAIIIEAEKESVLQRYCADLAAAAPTLHGGKIMGPIPAQIYQIRQWYRMRFLVMGAQNAALQSAVRIWLDKVKLPANVKVKIDVGPQNFL